MNLRNAFLVFSFAVFAAQHLVACSSDSSDEKQSNDGTSPAPSTSNSTSGGPSGSTSSGSGSGSTGQSACEAAGTMLCKRACACPTDGKCRVGVETDAGVASLNFNDEKACRDMYVALGCFGGGEPGFDYGRCENAAKIAACVESAGGGAVRMPAECRVSK